MGLGETVLLGFIAGVTILLGLPLGRMRRSAPSLRLFLNAVAVGILLFLVWDVLSAAWEPIDAGLVRIHDGAGGGGTVAFSDHPGAQIANGCIRASGITVQQIEKLA